MKKAFGAERHSEIKNLTSAASTPERSMIKSFNAKVILKSSLLLDKRIVLSLQIDVIWTRGILDMLTGRALLPGHRTSLMKGLLAGYFFF